MFAGGRKEKFVNGAHPPDYVSNLSFNPEIQRMWDSFTDAVSIVIIYTQNPGASASTHLFIDCEVRKIMHLVASVRLFIRPSVCQRSHADVVDRLLLFYILGILVVDYDTS